MLRGPWACLCIFLVYYNRQYPVCKWEDEGVLHFGGELCSLVGALITNILPELATLKTAQSERKIRPISSWQFFFNGVRF